jgi:hypothetical protein
MLARGARGSAGQVAGGSTPSHDDVFRPIERLSDLLHLKGILADEEFKSKEG